MVYKVLLIRHRNLLMQDSTRSQRGKSKKEPTVYTVPEHKVPEDLDAAILGEVDLRDKTNAAHTLPTAFFERFNTLRQQVCTGDIVSAAHTLPAASRTSQSSLTAGELHFSSWGLGLTSHWCTSLSSSFLSVAPHPLQVPAGHPARLKRQPDVCMHSCSLALALSQA